MTKRVDVQHPLVPAHVGMSTGQDGASMKKVQHWRE
jgi:ribosomal protein L39E